MNGLKGDFVWFYALGPSSHKGEATTKKKEEATEPGMCDSAIILTHKIFFSEKTRRKIHRRKHIPLHS